MFNNFSQNGRAVFRFAEEEARALKHGYIGDFHVLLGLLRAEDSVAARALDALGMTLEHVRTRAAQLVEPGDVPKGQLSLTPRVRRVIELAHHEAWPMFPSITETGPIDTEHLLLALVKLEEGVCGKILREAGVNTNDVYGQVTFLLGGTDRRDPVVPSPKISVTTLEDGSVVLVPPPGHKLDPKEFSLGKDGGLKIELLRNVA